MFDWLFKKRKKKRRLALSWDTDAAKEWMTRRKCRDYNEVAKRGEITGLVAFALRMRTVDEEEAWLIKNNVAIARGGVVVAPAGAKLVTEAD